MAYVDNRARSHASSDSAGTVAQICGASKRHLGAGKGIRSRRNREKLVFILRSGDELSKFTNKEIKITAFLVEVESVHVIIHG